MQRHANMYMSDPKEAGSSEKICSKTDSVKGIMQGVYEQSRILVMNFQKHGLSVFFKMNSYPEKTIIQKDTSTPMFRDGSPPGSADLGIFQGRTLEWVAISFSNA